MQKQIATNIKIRDWSKPLEDQRETTSYGDRIFSMPVYSDTDHINSPADIVKYEGELIKIWRSMALNPYISFAVNDIVNEIISFDDQNPYPITLDLTKTKFSASVKKKIEDEFTNVLKLLDFNNKAYTLIRDWYVDGHSYFFLDIGKNQKEISRIITLDPLRTKRITETNASGETVVKYVYQDFDMEKILYEIPQNQIIELNSGLMDDKHHIWVSHLNKAFVALNQVTSIEDAIVVYRIARAPERRVFYVDVGELPKSKAELYMRELINNFKNRMEYDSKTGTIKEKVKHMCLLDDVFLPRRDGSRGTEVSTLPGGSNLGEITDLEYFQKKLFRALNIPWSRWDEGTQISNVIGRTTEISRDELKYNKFIFRLRMTFNELFYEILKTSLRLKNIVKPDELEKERHSVVFKWCSDSMFYTFKKFDMLAERMEIAEKFMPYVGKLVSLKWLNQEMFDFSEDDIKNMQDEIIKEKPLRKKLRVGEFMDYDGEDEEDGNSDSDTDADDDDAYSRNTDNDRDDTEQDEPNDNKEENVWI